MRKNVSQAVKKFFAETDATNLMPNKNTKAKLNQLGAAPNSQGRDYLIAHYMGVELSRAEAVIANCCDCSGYYTDKRCDCENEVCPLYRWMPYGKMRKKHYIRPERREPVNQ